MPDSERKTVSASQCAALFNASPYMTRWMLWHYLKGDDMEEKPADARMNWGKKLQPLILEQASQDLQLEVLPNFNDEYVRANHAPLGYTADGYVIDPQKGGGTIEAKAVFDYGVWMRDWNGGKSVPKHYELQLAHQMTVGNGREPSRWGVIAVWVCGEMKYFHREFNIEVAREIERQAEELLASIRDEREPEPFGAQVELPVLQKLFPTEKNYPLDLSRAHEGMEWLQTAVMYADFAEREKFFGKAKDDIKAKLFGLMKDHDTLLLPDGASVSITQYEVKEHTRKASVQRRIKMHMPFSPDRDAIDDITGS